MLYTYKTRLGINLFGLIKAPFANFKDIFVVHPFQDGFKQKDTGKTQHFK